jgi:pimeloyl-ACP methyl ester carboxylesterase
MNPAFQLILLPGLGSDHRLLEPQRQEFPQLVIPAWIAPHKNESLPSYATRMAETIKPSPDAPLVLGGVSFGGMLAYEMARHLKPDAVVLIASCASRHGLGRLHRAGRWLLPLLPVLTWDIAKLLSPTAASLTSRVPRPERDVLVEMFKQSDSRFMHWTVQAILGWDPKPLEGVRVCQIHGRRDRVLPARHAQADEIIPDGGHLINVTHARQVNAFLRKAIESRQQRCLALLPLQ